MRRALLALVALAAACSHDRAAPDRCEHAFTSAANAGAFGGETYGAIAALGFGMSCDELTADDLACLDHAASASDVAACDHASRTVTDHIHTLDRGPRTPQPVDEMALMGLADAICACKQPSCLVGVGHTRRTVIERLAAGDSPRDGANLAIKERMLGCIDALPPLPGAH